VIDRERDELRLEPLRDGTPAAGAGPGQHRLERAGLEGEHRDHPAAIRPAKLRALEGPDQLQKQLPLADRAIQPGQLSAEIRGRGPGSGHDGVNLAAHGSMNGDSTTVLLMAGRPPVGKVLDRMRDQGRS